MKEKTTFIEELLRASPSLIQKLNVLAGERKVFDPLSDIGYSIRTNYPYSETWVARFPALAGFRVLG